MQSRHEALNIIARWEESRLTSPDPAGVPCCWCENPIDKEYIIDHKHYCEDCAKDLHRLVVIDDPVICDGCGKTLDDEYFNIGNDWYCETCFEKHFKEE